MAEHKNDIEQELLTAMDEFKAIAHLLIDKLISETSQPKKIAIEDGRYDEIQNADLINGQFQILNL